MNVVLYDGDCGFCNFWVQWILEKDQKNQFRFAALQSKFGQRFLEAHQLPQNQFDTVFLVSEDKFYFKLNAVAEIGNILGGKLRYLHLLRHLPSFIANRIYDKVAANRQKLATQSCLLPTPEERKKFITD